MDCNSSSLINLTLMSQIESTEKEVRFQERWQRRLLPFMVLTPVLLVCAFIILATLQMRKFESFVYPAAKDQVTSHLPEPSASRQPSPSEMKYLELYTLTKMEEYSIQRRYNQAAASMMSAIFTKY